VTIDILVLDVEEWWASQAINDTDPVIRSLLNAMLIAIIICFKGEMYGVV
jgi:hypothetical protein